MAKPEPNSMAEAMSWVARITTIGLEMVLPGLAGQWLDNRWHTGVFALIGFALGIIAGIWHLLVMTRTTRPGRSGQDDSSS